MKTVASFLLISAPFFGAIAYGQEPSGELDYPPTMTEISSLSRAQVIAELEAAKAIGQYIFGDSEEPSAPVADDSLSREQVRTEAAAAHANDSYTFGKLDDKAAFSVVRARRG